MKPEHAKDLKPGARVVVFMGEMVADIYGTPPFCTTATVLSAPDESDGFVWLGVDFTANDEPLPQRYRVSEVIGYLLSLATVERHADGSITGTLPHE